MLALGYGIPEAAGILDWPGPGAAYLLDDGTSYLWIFGKGEFRLLRLPGRQEIETRARALQRSCAAPDRPLPLEATRELAEWLLAPLAERWPPAEPLLILPSGGLHGLPWPLLPWKEGRILDHAPVIESTGLAGVEPEHPQDWSQRRLLAVGFNGDPERDRILLEYAEEEAGSVAALWRGPALLRVGEEARGELLSEAAAESYGLIHLSVHAQMHQGVSDRAYLRFAGSDPDEPPLSVQDIRALELDSELVFLSCCEASRGAFSRKGPSMDLGVAFALAGAACVLASPVRVDDEASRFIAPEFYRRLQGGLSITEALRRTQLELRDGGGRWSHPYYWANYHIHR
jgi:CHAT domain-containing protein